ncbi:MAG: hypothetical protein FWD11_06775 [Micrococcales bacterium]|nr:hypothetical protein [Micrococcales bacterium]
MSEYVTRLLRADLSRPTVDEWLAAHPVVPSEQVVDVAWALDEARVDYADDTGHEPRRILEANERGRPTEPPKGAGHPEARSALA